MDVSRGTHDCIMATGRGTCSQGRDGSRSENHRDRSRDYENLITGPVPVIWSL